MSQSFMVKIISNDNDSKMREIETEANTTLRQASEPSEISPEEHHLIEVETVTIDLDYILQPDDRIVIVPSHVRGSAPTCELRKLKKYLRHLEWVQEIGTVGDHENWRSPSGVLVQLNPDKRDSKVVDLASHKKCAQILGINFQGLYENVARF